MPGHVRTIDIMPQLYQKTQCTSPEKKGFGFLRSLTYVYTMALTLTVEQSEPLVERRHKSVFKVKECDGSFRCKVASNINMEITCKHFLGLSQSGLLSVT